ncbi:hypothetical protein STEG23_033705, partial [Scotinomys teguina]
NRSVTKTHMVLSQRHRTGENLGNRSVKQVTLYNLLSPVSSAHCFCTRGTGCLFPASLLYSM